MKPAIQIFPVPGLPEIKPGNDLPALIAAALGKQKFNLHSGDVVVIAQKIVSKSEGRIVHLNSVVASERSIAWAKEWSKDARLVELVFAEARRIVRMERGIIITETLHGFVCPNAGIDLSNADEGTAILLPIDPDASARALKLGLGAALGVDISIIVSDTFGRPWREGLVNVALGVAGLAPLLDYRGQKDANGKALAATIIAQADELASAAELVMGKSDRVPVAIIRGLEPSPGTGSGRDLIRPAESDLFRY